MLTTHCLKNLIRKFGGTPPKGNSTTACLSELCKSDSHSRTARVETWNLTQNIEIPNKEIIICNFVATAPDNSPPPRINFTTTVDGKSEDVCSFNVPCQKMDTTYPIKTNLAFRFIPQFDGVLCKMLLAINKKSTDFYWYDSSESGAQYIEKLCPHSPTGKYKLSGFKLQGTATVIINE